MTGEILIDRLRLYARHGVMDQERAVGNEFEVTVLIRYDMKRAAERDSLDGTVDYGEAAAIIRREMEQPARLLEHVAWRINRALLARWPAIQGGHTRIAKLAPPIPGASLAGSVAVTLPIRP